MELDPEILAAIEEAQAAMRRKHADPNYVEPTPYVPKPRPKPEPPKKKWPPTVDEADKMDAECQGYLDRAGKPLKAASIAILWADNYARQYSPPSDNNGLDAEHMESYGFGATQWHDVFQKAQRISLRKPAPGNPPPMRLIDELARQERTRQRHLLKRRDMIAEARKRGQLREAPDDDELPGAYPRTYL